MKKIDLKAIFLSLLARRLRRAGDSQEPPRRSAMGTAQADVVPQFPLETTASGRQPASARAEATSEASPYLPEKRPDLPESWLARRSDGPPAHWIERVRQGAPELLQSRERADLKASIHSPAQLQRKPVTPVTTHWEGPISPLSLPEDQRVQQGQSGRNVVSHAPAIQRGARVQIERVESELPKDAPQGPLTEMESQPDEHSRFKEGESVLPIFSVKPERRGAQARDEHAKETSKPGNADPTIQSAHGEDEREQLNTQDDWTTENEANLRKAAAAPRFRMGESGKHLDLRIWEERKSENSDSPKPPVVMPVKIIEWKESSRVTARADQVKRDDNPKKPLPIQTANDVAGYHNVADRQPAIDVTHYPDVTGYRDEKDVTHREAQGFPVNRERSGSDSGYWWTEKKEEESVGSAKSSTLPDRQVISSGALSDRWPELLGAFAADDSDEVMAVWRELNHHRRLTLEQRGGVWNE